MHVSQRRAATVLRLVYAIWVVTGLFGLLYVPSILIEADDAAATAGNIVANESLFRAGIVSQLITQLVFVFAALLLYRLFESVSKDAASLMVVLALVSVPIAMLNELTSLAALHTVDDAARMMFFLDLHEQGIMIASIFWGLWLFPLGYLVYTSGFFPKLVGVAVLLGGVGYTLGSFTRLLVPNLAGIVPSVFEVLTFGEVVFVLWLVIGGVRLPRTSDT